MAGLKIIFPKIKETKLITKKKGKTVREATYQSQYFVLDDETQTVEAIYNSVLDVNKHLDTVK